MTRSDAAPEPATGAELDEVRRFWNRIASDWRRCAHHRSSAVGP